MAVSDNHIYVNYGGVSSVGEELPNANRPDRNVPGELQNGINPLRGSGSGASEAEYINVQNRWNSDINDMSSLLTRYGSTIDDMSNNYGTTDNNLASQWSAIH